MAEHESASQNERRKAAQALSGWLAREMAAAADQSASGALSSESAERAIDQCADLMNRYWPEDAGGECASGTSHRTGESYEPALLHAAVSNNGNEFIEGRLGRFEVRRALGHGGFGVVFLVFDPRLNREAALKIPRPEILVSPTLRQRFLREAQSAAVLDHPSILSIYETGEIGPVGYILSAYCKGADTGSVVQRSAWSNFCEIDCRDRGPTCRRGSTRPQPRYLTPRHQAVERAVGTDCRVAARRFAFCSAADRFWLGDASG
jgi:hypothetical protein